MNLARLDVSISPTPSRETDKKTDAERVKTVLRVSASTSPDEPFCRLQHKSWRHAQQAGGHMGRPVWLVARGTWYVRHLVWEGWRQHRGCQVQATHWGTVEQQCRGRAHKGTLRSRISRKWTSTLNHSGKPRSSVKQKSSWEQRWGLDSARWWNWHRRFFSPRRNYWAAGVSILNSICRDDKGITNQGMI